MRRWLLPLALAAGLAAAWTGQAGSQVPVRYHTRRPTCGSKPVKWRWYVCWPDSNRALFVAVTPDTVAVIVHHAAGERVRVEAVDAAGRTGPRSTASAAWRPMEETPVPGQVSAWLYPCRPNPFNAATTIRFDLPVAARVKLAVYAASGQLVAVLIEQELASGSHDMTWNGRDSRGRSMPSGVYFCRLEAGSYRETGRMMLIK